MLRNLEELAAHGLDVVPATKRESFQLMLMVRDRYTPGRDPEAATGSLDRFSAALQGAPGTRALLSQESLAAARPRQVSRLLAACGNREVHVIATVRDLARQLPSSWQQELKAGGDMRFRPYLGELQRREQAGSGAHPWIHLDPPAVLARWRAALPARQIHVVTVPPAGSTPTLLLERFCRVLDVDPSHLVPEDRPSNTSLGRVQAEVLRRVNSELPDELRSRYFYGGVGKRSFAGPVLGAQESQPIRVPSELREWCDEVTARHITALEVAGYQVEGTLEDLRSEDRAFEDGDSAPHEEEVAAAAVSALSTMLATQMRNISRDREVTGKADEEAGAGVTVRLGRRLGQRVRRRRSAPTL